MVDTYGCVIRGDTTEREIALVFTADEFGEGAPFIVDVLEERGAKGSFFLTGNYLRSADHFGVLERMVAGGHYVGPHADRHLLYCDWTNRDSLLVSKNEFEDDLKRNYAEMKKWGIDESEASFFIPPYEWYNRQIVEWAASLGVRLVNFTPGLGTAADYTYPEMGKRYMSSERLYEQVLTFEEAHPHGLNGAILLIHLGTDPRRADKFYHWLPTLMTELTNRGYTFRRIDKLVR